VDTDRITYRQLDNLLVQLGFSTAHIEPKWLRYQHPASNTMIVLPEKDPDELVRITDAVSARRHLVEKGLISSEDLDAILSRRASKE
jgi:hypothetical protein